MFFHLFRYLAGCIIGATLYLALLRVIASIARRNAVQKYRCQAPAAYPHKDPFFGLDSVRDAICAAKARSSIARQIHQYAQYGSTFSSKFFTTPVISTIEPENVKAVLSTHFEDYSVGSRRKEAFFPLLGRSIFQVDGPQWKHSRHLLQSCFARDQVDDLQVLDVHVSKLINALPTNGAMVDLGDWFPRLTADVTTACFFGHTIDSLGNDSLSFGAEFVKAIHDAQDGCEERWKIGVFAKVVPQREFYRNVKRIHDFMDQHIETAIASFNSSSRISKDNKAQQDRHVFLHDLREVTDDRQVLRDELLTIFIASVDTSAAVLTNLFFVLAKRPDIWQLLRNEVAPLSGGKPDIDQLQSMRYHQYCLKESLRLHPIALSNSRTAYKDTILPRGGGADYQSPVFVAKGTMVAFGIAAMHRSKSLWGEDADEFRPERWGNEKQSWKFIPFNGGPRVCIGERFAMNLTTYTLVRLVQSFHSLESQDDGDWVEGAHLACTSHNGAKVILRAS